ncbi:MAG: pyridoxal phosphate-dependent class II aminotransferase [Prevotella sp.]|nr:pyridoxal phosphate-dependent class II aminotransferase [Prevotella sp.]
MLHGHGDDLYRYNNITMNFSSNIYSHADMAELKQHLCQHLSLIDSYPEPEPRSLANAIAQQRGVSPDCILVTSGATEAIYLIAQALRHCGYTHAHILQPTFNEYADACRMFGLQLTEDDCDGTVTWLCNPNNPTGSLIPASDEANTACTAKDTCRTLPAIRVVDQSYEDYTLASLMSPAEAVAKGNIFQLHSLTKTYAVPGLRIGYVVAAPHLINILRRFVRPWAVNALAIEAGLWLVSNNVKAIADLPAYLAEAERLHAMLSAIPGLSLLPTHTNFMLCHIKGHTAAELKDYLARRHGILIRDASNFVGLTPHHFRVAAQSPAENDALVAAIGEYLHPTTQL